MKRIGILRGEGESRPSPLDSPDSVHACRPFRSLRISRHMNHSSRFWNLVEQYEPGYQLLDKELGKAWRQVPAWMFVG